MRTEFGPNADISATPLDQPLRGVLADPALVGTIDNPIGISPLNRLETFGRYKEETTMIQDSVVPHAHARCGAALALRALVGGTSPPTTCQQYKTAVQLKPDGARQLLPERWHADCPLERPSRSSACSVAAGTSTPKRSGTISTSSRGSGVCGPSLLSTVDWLPWVAAVVQLGGHPLGQPALR